MKPAISIRSHTADIHRVLRDRRKQALLDWKEKNMFFFQSEGVVYKHKGNLAIFDWPGHPKVIFCLTTGTWTLSSNGKTEMFHGGATAFLTWYKGKRIT